MATLQDISSPVWTMSTSGGGAITEGVNAIKQCIDVILRTTQGSDPLRPTFGTLIYTYQDKPVNIAIPSIKKEILDAIALWETRVKITNITHTVNGGNIIFNVGFQLTDSSLQNSIAVSVGNGGVFTSVSNTNLILRGYFPPNPSNYQYTASLVLNGETILPFVPDSGFSTLTDLYNWINNNWVNYGKWYLTSNSILGFINPGFTSGSFEVAILTGTQFRGIIPDAPVGYKYDVKITVDGTLYENTGSFGDDFSDDFSDTNSIMTADGVREFAQDVLGDLGTWELIYAAGSFSDDFGGDFDTDQQYLSIVTSDAETIVIDISIVAA